MGKLLSDHYVARNIKKDRKPTLVRWARWFMFGAIPTIIMIGVVAGAMTTTLVLLTNYKFTP